jgi:hypothetical protein
MAEVIMSYCGAFLLGSMCVALGIFILAMVPVGIIAILRESGALDDKDIDRLLRKIRLKRPKGT